MEFKGNEIWDERHLVGYLSHNSDGWMLFTVDHRLVHQTPDRGDILLWAERHRDTLPFG